MGRKIKEIRLVYNKNNKKLMWAARAGGGTIVRQYRGAIILALASLYYIRKTCADE